MKTRSARFRPAVAPLVAAARLAACAQSPSPSEPTSQLPGAPAAPGDSVVIVGAVGAGLGAGARLYGFSPDLAPALPGTMGEHR